jgi:hypothetical protein
MNAPKCCGCGCGRVPARLGRVLCPDRTVIALGAGVAAEDDEDRPWPKWWLDRLDPRLAELEARLAPPPPIPPPPPPLALSEESCEVDLFSCESREWFEPASRPQDDDDDDDAPLP